MLPWKCRSGHIIELCDECNHCTKFQFYTENVRDIHFFVILHNCPHCDVTIDLICYHNKINIILHHFESCFQEANKFLFIGTQSQAILYYAMVRFRTIDLKSHPIAQFIKKLNNS